MSADNVCLIHKKPTYFHTVLTAIIITSAIVIIFAVRCCFLQLEVLMTSWTRSKKILNLRIHRRSTRCQVQADPYTKGCGLVLQYFLLETLRMTCTSCKHLPDFVIKRTWQQRTSLQQSSESSMWINTEA